MNEIESGLQIIIPDIPSVFTDMMLMDDNLFSMQPLIRNNLHKNKDPMVRRNSNILPSKYDELQLFLEENDEPLFIESPDVSSDDESDILSPRKLLTSSGGSYIGPSCVKINKTLDSKEMDTNTTSLSDKDKNLNDLELKINDVLSRIELSKNRWKRRLSEENKMAKEYMIDLIERQKNERFSLEKEYKNSIKFSSLSSVGKVSGCSPLTPHIKRIIKPQIHTTKKIMPITVNMSRDIIAKRKNMMEIHNQSIINFNKDVKLRKENIRNSMKKEIDEHMKSFLPLVSQYKSSGGTTDFEGKLRQIYCPKSDVAPSREESSKNLRLNKK